MSKLIQAVTLLWRFRGRLLLCVFALPLLAYLYSQNKVESYTATTTLYVNPNLVTSPLLQDMTPNEHRAILARQLASPEVLEASLAQTGLMLPGVDEATRQKTLRSVQGRLRLNVLSAHLVQVKLRSTDRASVLPLLEAVSSSFRDVLLSSERYSDGATLAQLAEKVKAVEAKLSAAETDGQQVLGPEGMANLRSEVAQARKEYQTQNRRAQLGNATAALRVLEAPTLVANPVPPLFDILLNAAFIGLLLGLVLVWASHKLDATLRSDKDIYAALHLRVLGRMPDFGKLHVINGRLNS